MTKMARNRPGPRPMSEICADCGAGETNWVSINRGVYICNDCLSVHRQLGRHISIVKHLKKSQWHPNQINMVQHLASAGANSIWEHTLLDPAQVRSGKRKPNPSDHIYPKKDEFVRAKYLQLSYVHRLNHGDSADISMQLHSSARTGNLETCLRLLSLGAQANYVHPEKRNTPLHVAAKAGQILQVELLVIYGADPCALDPNRKTPEDLARMEGHNELADRLVELKYELTDRLAYYICQHKPDHKSGIHYKLVKPSTGQPYGIEGRKRLESLNDQTFEELAMDIYDEIDRRELEQIWQETQRNIIIPGNKGTLAASEYQNVPFLPLISQYSQTRNQGRQKLALFKEHEFQSLIADIIADAVRRQNLYGSSIVETIEDDPIYDLPPDEMLDYNSIEQSVAERNETVSLEKYEELQKRLEAKEKECTVLQENNRELSTKVTSLAKECHLLNKKLKALTTTPNLPPVPPSNLSTNEIGAQLGSAFGPKSQSGRPNSVYNDSSSSHSSIHSSDGRRRTICGDTPLDSSSGRVPSHEELQMPIKMPPNIVTEEKDNSRVDSNYDNNSEDNNEAVKSNGEPGQSPSPTVQTDVSHNEQENVQQNTNSNNNQSPSEGASPVTLEETPVADSPKDSAMRASPANVIDEKMWPDKMELDLKTEQLTRNIQALHSAAQSKKIESYLQCAENIYSAVNELITLFPKPNCKKSVKTVLQQLCGSAHKLRQRCKEIGTEDHEVNDKVKQITEEIMSYAYAVAKAEKQLVTMVPHTTDVNNQAQEKSKSVVKEGV